MVLEVALTFHLSPCLAAPHLKASLSITQLSPTITQTHSPHISQLKAFTMASDLETLIDMGFEKARAELAVKKTGGRMFTNPRLPHMPKLTHRRIVQGALEWLEKNQDRPLDEIQSEEANKPEEDDEEATKAKIAELETGQAKSMVCNECGKKFRSLELAEFHASKT